MIMFLYTGKHGAGLVGYVIEYHEVGAPHVDIYAYFM